MPQFDASGIVEGLECKLRPYADFDGIIPEPSDQQIAAFLAGLKRITATANEKVGIQQEVDVADAEQVAKAMEALDTDEFVKVTNEMAGLYADLCSGTPSKAQILAVPMRRRNLFYQWLQTEVMSPEAEAPAGSGQLNHLPLRAAG